MVQKTKIRERWVIFEIILFWNCLTNIYLSLSIISPIPDLLEGKVQCNNQTESERSGSLRGNITCEHYFSTFITPISCFRVLTKYLFLLILLQVQYIHHGLQLKEQSRQKERVSFGCYCFFLLSPNSNDCFPSHNKEERAGALGQGERRRGGSGWRR